MSLAQNELGGVVLRDWMIALSKDPVMNALHIAGAVNA